MFSKRAGILVSKLGAEPRPRAEKRKIHSPVAGEKTKNSQPGRGRENKIPAARPRAEKQAFLSPGRGQENEKSTARSRARKQDPRSPAAGGH